jgi:hypothetical protein
MSDNEIETLKKQNLELQEALKNIELEKQERLKLELDAQNKQKAEQERMNLETEITKNVMEKLGIKTQSKTDDPVKQENLKNTDDKTERFMAAYAKKHNITRKKYPEYIPGNGYEWGDQ